MRSVVVGLALAVGLVAGAKAKECRLNGAILEVVDTPSTYFLNEPRQRPDLIGQTFKVGRFAAVPKRQMSARLGQETNVGYEAYEIVGGAGSFVVKHEFLDGSPARVVISSEASGPNAAVDWSRARREIVKSRAKWLDEINGGPLSSLGLKLKFCG